MSHPQTPPPDFSPSEALARVASMGYVAASALSTIHDVPSLDVALDAVREYAHRLLALSPGEATMLRHLHDQAGHPPPDISRLSGLLAHHVQQLHHDLYHSPAQRLNLSPLTRPA